MQLLHLVSQLLVRQGRSGSQKRSQAANSRGWLIIFRIRVDVLARSDDLRLLQLRKTRSRSTSGNSGHRRCGSCRQNISPLFRKWKIWNFSFADESIWTTSGVGTLERTCPHSASLCRTSGICCKWSLKQKMKLIITQDDNRANKQLWDY